MRRARSVACMTQLQAKHTGADGFEDDEDDDVDSRAGASDRASAERCARLAVCHGFLGVLLWYKAGALMGHFSGPRPVPWQFFRGQQRACLCPAAWSARSGAQMRLLVCAMTVPAGLDWRGMLQALPGGVWVLRTAVLCVVGCM